MDRRQRKTREAIFAAFIALLSKKDFSQITVGEIIDKADVGRATFYSHFETKDFLLVKSCFVTFLMRQITDKLNTDIFLHAMHQTLYFCIFFNICRRMIIIFWNYLLAKTMSYSCSISRIIYKNW